MIDPDTPPAGQTYRIGAVARLTGIPPDTLRVWERRYAVVTPFRSEAGTRLYAADDLARLTLIKRLVDNGDAISHVARLSLDDLRERVRGISARALDPEPGTPCRVGVLGAHLPAMLKLEGIRRPAQASDPTDETVEFVGVFEDEAEFRSAAPGLDLDLMLLECPSIQPDQVHRISDLLACSGATRAVVIYEFASRAVLERLQTLKLSMRRAPVDVAEVRRWCASAHRPAAELAAAESLAEVDLSGPLPQRRYDSAALARIAAASPTVRCECPHHLVQLVSSLVAFERYSQECAHRNADDAALHAFLHAATAHARAGMEAALARVVDAEGITF